MKVHSLKEEEVKRIAGTMYRYDKIAAEHVPSLHDIDGNSIKRFQEEGYLIVDNVLSAGEIKNAVSEVDDIINGRIEGPRLQRVKPENELHTDEDREYATRKIYEYIDYAPVLGNIAKHKGIVGLVEKLIGEKSKLIEAEGHLKPPFGGGEKPWHQDMAYGGLFYEKQIVVVWIALDEAGLDNGCMHLIPRSHARGGVPHYSIRDWQICDRDVILEQDVAAIMQPGAALFFSGMLHHGSPPNFSPKRRRSLQLRFAPVSSQMMSKKQYKLMFTNEMTKAEC